MGLGLIAFLGTKKAVSVAFDNEIGAETVYTCPESHGDGICFLDFFHNGVWFSMGHAFDSKIQISFSKILANPIAM